MTADAVLSRTRGRIWFEALAGSDATLLPAIPSILAADTTIGERPARILSVVPDPDSRFPCARHGEVGVEEGWNLAKQVREVLVADRESRKRAIIAIVDVPSQAYGRREEMLGIFLAAAAATDAYVSARMAGHPIVALIAGRAISGGFLTHGVQADRLLAFNDPGVVIHAMAKKAAAVVTRRTVQELDKLAEKVPPLSYRIQDYAKLGMLYKLIDGVQPDSPTPEQIEMVRSELESAIEDASTGSKDLSNRLETEAARTNRLATLEVRRRLTQQWGG